MWHVLLYALLLYTSSQFFFMHFFTHFFTHPRGQRVLHTCPSTSSQPFPVRVVAARRDGSVCYKVFDPCAVRISVEEGVGHRRHLALSLVPRDQLPASARVGE